MEPLTDQLHTLFRQAIEECHKEVADSKVHGYTANRIKEWGNPTSDECKRLEKLYRKMSPSFEGYL